MAAVEPFASRVRPCASLVSLVRPRPCLTWVPSDGAPGVGTRVTRVLGFLGALGAYRSCITMSVKRKGTREKLPSKEQRERDLFLRAVRAWKVLTLPTKKERKENPRDPTKKFALREYLCTWARANQLTKITKLRHEFEQLAETNGHLEDGLELTEVSFAAAAAKFRKMADQTSDSLFLELEDIGKFRQKVSKSKLLMSWWKIKAKGPVKSKRQLKQVYQKLTEIFRGKWDEEEELKFEVCFQTLGKIQLKKKLKRITYLLDNFYLPDSNERKSLQDPDHIDEIGTEASDMVQRKYRHSQIRTVKLHGKKMFHRVFWKPDSRATVSPESL
eukprot:Skav216163  [mRNA]  locus=scaffold1043:288:1277:+ [translate_table: standard]